MEEVGLLGENPDISTLEELLRQVRSRNEASNEQSEDIHEVIPQVETVFDKELFIEEIRPFGCLWNTSLPSYKDRTVKANAWKKLSQIFDRDGQGNLTATRI